MEQVKKVIICFKSFTAPFTPVWDICMTELIKKGDKRINNSTSGKWKDQKN